ncbi:hypothetical protein PIB30_075850 [Stylosanthes scabra]|uniref:Uncharacterized protein n=1 Tax=Stylosanthes scabra TaxID=79078 RepID=A0ABU6TQW5_9FABA|nr:hypothetical protein [Stylosanthes scabra]
MPDPSAGHELMRQFYTCSRRIRCPFDRIGFHHCAFSRAYSTIAISGHNIYIDVNSLRHRGNNASTVSVEPPLHSTATRRAIDRIRRAVAPLHDCPASRPYLGSDPSMTNHKPA